MYFFIWLQLRTNVARVISAIALFEYPDHWPDFFDRMIDMVKSTNDFKSHGAMQTLIEYCAVNNDLKLDFIMKVHMNMLEIVNNSNQVCITI